MNVQVVSILGMQLERWTHLSCTCDVGVEESWATIYSIESGDKGKGHATELLLKIKTHYQAQGKVFGSSVAISEAMRHLLLKHNIKEYDSE